MSPDRAVPYRHFDVATIDEFEFYLNTWAKDKDRGNFPVLLLAFHGDQKGLSVIKDEATLFTDELVAHLSSNRYNDAFIHFSSCHVLKNKEMEKLLYKTGALSVSGYVNKQGVGYYQSAAFELLFLAELFAYKSKETKSIGPPKTSKDMRNFVRDSLATNKELLRLGRALGFHLWYCVDFGQTKTDSKLRNIHAVSRTEMEKKWGA